MYERGAHGLVSHGVLLLEAEGERVVALDAYIDARLTAVFDRAG